MSTNEPSVAVNAPDPAATAAPAATVPAPAPHWRVTGVVLAAAVIAVIVAVALAAALPASTVTIFETREPGPVVSYGLPAVRALFDLCSALSVGWLLGAVVLAVPKADGGFDVAGFRCAQAAGTAALIQTIAALLLIPLTFAAATGRGLLDSIGADRVAAAVQFFATSRSALIAAVAAAVVAVMARVVLRPATACVLLVVAVLAALPIAISGHAAGSDDHDFATDTLIYHVIGVSIWVGGLVAFLGLARQRAAHLELIARRYSALALVGYLVVMLSGISAAWVRLSAFSHLFSTDYGRLILVKTALLLVLGLFGVLQRRRSVLRIQQGDRRSLLRLSVWEIGVMAATMGVAVALGRTTPPPPAPIAPTDIALVLGYDLPGEPTFVTLLTAWRFDLIFGTAALLLAALYLWGLRRVRQRGIRWPVQRTIAWLGGCLALLMATSSGFGRYAPAQLSIHMISHMTLGMMVPILLVLGAPTTLALRALPASRTGIPGMREAVVGFTRSRAIRWLTHPLVVFPLFIGSFYAIYFTGLFELMIGSHVGHLVMNLHFILMGYLYYWVIIGIDPAPRRLGSVAKLALLLGALPFHAFFGITMMNSRNPIGADYYTRLDLPWVSTLLSDQHLAGGIAWGGSEVPLVLVTVALLSQWYRNDERDARRLDRRADREANSDLAAYNAMLAKLAEQDRPRARRPTR